MAHGLLGSVLWFYEFWVFFSQYESIEIKWICEPLAHVAHLKSNRNCKILLDNEVFPQIIVHGLLIAGISLESIELLRDKKIEF